MGNKKNKLIHLQGLCLETSEKGIQKPSAHVPWRLEASSITRISNVVCVLYQQ